MASVRALLLHYGGRSPLGPIQTSPHELAQARLAGVRSTGEASENLQPGALPPASPLRAARAGAPYFARSYPTSSNSFTATRCSIADPVADRCSIAHSAISCAWARHYVRVLDLRQKVYGIIKPNVASLRNNRCSLILAVGDCSLRKRATRETRRGHACTAMTETNEACKTVQQETETHTRAVPIHFHERRTLCHRDEQHHLVENIR